MSIGTKGKSCRLGASFTADIIRQIENGTIDSDLLIYFVDSDNTAGHPTVELSSATNKRIEGQLSSGLTYDGLNPTSVDANGNVTYPRMGTYTDEGEIWVTSRDSTSGDGKASVAGDVGKAIEGFDGGTSNTPAGNAAVASADGDHKIIARSGNLLRVRLQNKAVN